MVANCSSVIVRKAHDSAASCICSSQSARSLVTRVLIFSDKSRVLKASLFSCKIARATERSCSLGGDLTELEPSLSRRNRDGDTMGSIGVLNAEAREQMIELLVPLNIRAKHPSNSQEK